MKLTGRLRLIPSWLNGYGFSDPEKNGEYRYLRSLPKDLGVVFDVGANVGHHATVFLDTFPNCVVHCFEPVSAAFSELKNRHGDNPRVFLVNAGLSSADEQLSMQLDGPTAGSNSVHPRFGSRDQEPRSSDVEVCRFITLDGYVEEHSIKAIDFCKIDVEGHELSVLHGAVDSLRDQKIAAVQFEYGPSFSASGATLEETHRLLHGAGYDLARLLPFGTRRVRGNPLPSGLENFEHSNWVAKPN